MPPPISVTLVGLIRCSICYMLHQKISYLKNKKLVVFWFILFVAYKEDDIDLILDHISVNCNFGVLYL